MLEQGRPAKALPSYRKALAIRPDLAVVGIGVGVTGREVGQTVEDDGDHERHDVVDRGVVAVVQVTAGERGQAPSRRLGRLFGQVVGRHLGPTGLDLGLQCQAIKFGDTVILVELLVYSEIP